MSSIRLFVGQTLVGRLLIVLLPLLLVMPVSLLAQTETQTPVRLGCQFDPPSIAPGQGSNFTLQLQSDEDQPIQEIRLVLRYPATNVQFLDQLGEEEGVNLTPGSALAGFTVSENLINTIDGTVRLIATRAQQESLSAGQQVVVSAALQGVSDGLVSVQFAEANATSFAGTPITVITEPCFLAVGTAELPTPTNTPTQTPTPTDTLLPGADTATPTSTPTVTTTVQSPVATPTFTPTPDPGDTVTPIATATPTFTPEVPATPTPTDTMVVVTTPTPGAAQTGEQQIQQQQSPLPTPTFTATAISGPGVVETPTSTPTETPVLLGTPTPVITATGTLTPTPTPTVFEVLSPPRFDIGELSTIFSTRDDAANRDLLSGDLPGEGALAATENGANAGAESIALARADRAATGTADVLAQPAVIASNRWRTLALPIGWVALIGSVVLGVFAWRLRHLVE